jgi:class 3 adenylate cyclase/tetratricopeptide (TPR) repeat protein
MADINQEGVKMKCPKCQFENREGVKFCEECGANFELRCPNCTASIQLGRKFCGECGFKLTEPSETPSIDYSEPQSYTPKFLADKILTSRSSIEGERKLVTVLFADVANYTSMAERLDPEEVHQIMDGCFAILMDAIHHYEGTINQFTGDGVMALFGAPVAHEDHAQRACYAALAIQGVLENYNEKIQQNHVVDFKMRIGLNSGPVVVASIGDDLRMDYTAVGDTTNLAARLQSKARPGSIFVSEATHKLAKDFFHFKQLGKVEVKGKEQLQEAYELIKTGEVKTRIKAALTKGLTKFVGRENSMAALNEPYERVLSGSGQAVGIVGEAGVGKSRLLFEFIDRLPQGEFTHLEGHCVHYGSRIAYLPILDILRALFGIKEGDPEFFVKKKLAEKIEQLGQQLVGTLPAFQDLLSLKVDHEKYLQLDPSQKKIRIFEAVLNLFIQESEHKPLLLVIEDLHWIDKISEDFISYLIDSMANTGILLILLYRLEYTHPWGSKSYYTQIGLTQLGSASSRQLVQAILKGGEVASELQEFVLGRSGGNPLFVEELTYSLLENGTIQKTDHQYILTRNASDINVPDTLQAIIAARIDRVAENLKGVMQVASVIGREFAFRVLEAIMGTRDDLKSYLLKLQRLEFIAQKRLFPELDYIFKHALIQEVAYNSLLKKRREAIHESIGRAIESLYPERLEEYCELLAYHYSWSKNTEKAIHYSDMANQKAIKANAAEQAKAYFDDAMKLLDTLPETPNNRRRRISLLMNQLLVMFLLFKYPEYHDLLTRFEPTAISLQEEGLLGGYYARLGTCEWGYGNFDLALQLDAKAAELCETGGNLEDEAYAYGQMQWCHLYKGNYEHIFQLKKRVLQILQKKFNLRTYSWAMQASAIALGFLGRWKEAEAEGHQLLKIAEQFSDDSVASMAAWGLSMTYNSKRDAVRAVEYGEMAVRKATTPGDKVWGECHLAWAWCRAGKIQKGVELLAIYAPLQRAVRFFPGEHFTVCLGEGYFLAGEYDKASRIMAEILEIAQVRGLKWYIGEAHRILGEIALKTLPDQAASHFDRSIAMFGEINAENEMALSYAGYGRYHRQTGHLAKAREFLTRALEIFERLGTLVEPQKVKKELADLTKG